MRGLKMDYDKLYKTMTYIKEVTLLTEEGHTSLKDIEEFIDKNKETMKVLRAYIKEIDAFPFQIQTAVMYKGDTYLIKTVSLEMLSIDLIDTKSKVIKVDLSELLTYNKGAGL